MSPDDPVFDEQSDYDQLIADLAASQQREAEVGKLLMNVQVNNLAYLRDTAGKLHQSEQAAIKLGRESQTELNQIYSRLSDIAGKILYSGQAIEGLNALAKERDQLRDALEKLGEYIVFCALDGKIPSMAEAVKLKEQALGGEKATRCKLDTGDIILDPTDARRPYWEL